ncbi:PAS domain-containing sensor histidine kinase [Thermicanus aegyptius]|uniref:PAS domain-containing sensor histidine kinase n=1 Tax=Thermicanus aegyptius TaxID=94009 RepID=UPI0003F77AFD|nr:PAS domain-containing sensor histidine kinase [Thermicanus aegyptius]
MAWWNRIKIRLLLFGVTMSILPILIIGWYNVSVVKGWLEEGVKEKEVTIVERAAGEVERRIEGLMQRMKFLSDLNGRIGEEPLNLSRWEVAFYAFLKQNQEVENLYLFDLKGRVLLHAQRFEVIPPQEISPILLQRLRESRSEEPQIGSLHYAKDGTPYLYVALPYFSKTGAFTGGFLVEVNFKGTFSRISAIHMGETGYLYLIDGDRHLLAHTEHSQVLQKREVIQAKALQDMVNKRCNIPVPAVYTSYTGEKVIGVYAPISISSWGVVVEQPLQEVYTPIRRLLQRLLLVMLMIMGAVAGTSIFFGIRFTRPIEKMERAVRKVTDGELTTKIEHPSSDEFGRLAKAFNRMMEQLKENQERLEQEKERLDTIINGSGAGFALVRDDFSVTWMNDRLKEWLGRDEGTFPCYHLFAGGNLPCQDCPLLPGEIVPKQNEVVTKLEKGRETSIYRHRIYPLERVMEGDPQFLVVVEDITEQKKMEEMVIQADKLSALGMMASGFAHEVNNPLASISAYAEDLKERLESEGEGAISSQEVGRYLGIIQQNVARCKKIIDSLLHFSRKSSLEQGEVDLEELIQESLLLMGHVLKRKEIKVVNRVEEVPLLQGDPLQIQQVFMNIFQNAVDAMEPGKKLLLQSDLDGEHLKIQVIDEGTGMSEEEMSRAFDPFYTTKPVGKGTGLGLYIAYQVMKKMGGEIRLASKKGEGTTVTLLFPLFKSGEKEEGTG